MGIPIGIKVTLGRYEGVVVRTPSDADVALGAIWIKWSHSEHVVRYWKDDAVLIRFKFGLKKIRNLPAWF